MIIFHHLFNRKVNSADDSYTCLSHKSQPKHADKQVNSSEELGRFGIRFSHMNSSKSTLADKRSEFGELH